MLFICCFFVYLSFSYYLLLLVYFLLVADCMLFLIFHVATHSSRVPTSGSQTGDTLGKALASVSEGNQTQVLNQCWCYVTVCTLLKHCTRVAFIVYHWFRPPINRIYYFADLPHWQWWFILFKPINTSCFPSSLSKCEWKAPVR